MLEEFLKQDRQQAYDRINSETGKIPWSELQTHFAAGTTLFISDSLDLVDVALAIQTDEIDKVSAWRESDQIIAVSDDQAKNWHQQGCSLWAVVVKPWVLVQDIKAT